MNPDAIIEPYNILDEGARLKIIEPHSGNLVEFIVVNTELGKAFKPISQTHNGLVQPFGFWQKLENKVYLLYSQ